MQVLYSSYSDPDTNPECNAFLAQTHEFAIEMSNRLYQYSFLIKNEHDLMDGIQASTRDE